MKNTGNTNFILTGATGILGSHILYELMLTIHNSGYCGEIVLPIRAKKEMTSRMRFEELFTEDMTPDYLKEVDTDRICREHITIVDFDLRYSKDVDILPSLKSGKYTLIHCAASVNLGTNAYAFEEIRHNNYLGTLNLIHSLHSRLEKVSYVSSAFSLSSRDGQITNERENEDYRNHYEKFKVQTEQEIVQICEAYGLALQITRPSIICGRLVDYPHHVIPKFLVFYLFGAFFYRAKQHYGNQHIRILMNATSGLNIVPVDYAAKAIVRALATDIKELNIVSRKNLPNTFTIPTMLRLVGWQNYEFREQVPADMNAVEKLYYKTVGPQLNNYLATPDNGDGFNTDTLNWLMEDIGEPNVEAHFQSLCTYAVERQFTNLLA
ncbi:MAG: SDR family oxidoreductase [Taibaiella sp.]|nr:SDR family oxidoreductase [Taibaiella sp.]